MGDLAGLRLLLFGFLGGLEERCFGDGYDYGEGCLELIEWGLEWRHASDYNTLLKEWEVRTYSLIELYRMIPYKAARFLSISQKLGSMIRLIEKNSNQNQTISQSDRQLFLKHVEVIESDCQEINLTMTLAEIPRIKLCVKDSTYLQLAHRFGNLFERMYDETEGRLFFCLSNEKQNFYSDPGKAFGEDVCQKFSSTIRDIEESGKCYATGRNTSCVLHLMRILEAGLNALAKHFGIQYEHQNWEVVINQITAQIKNIEALPSAQKPPDWQNDRQFYSGAAVHFKFLKDAYRNYAMHIHEWYDEPQAKSIYDHAREFMRQLSTRISE